MKSPRVCAGRIAPSEAVASIRRLKRIAAESKALLWPNHDLPFYRSLPARFELG